MRQSGLGFVSNKVFSDLTELSLVLCRIKKEHIGIVSLLKIMIEDSKERYIESFARNQSVPESLIFVRSKLTNRQLKEKEFLEITSEMLKRYGIPRNGRDIIAFHAAIEEKILKDNGK